MDVDRMKENKKKKERRKHSRGKKRKERALPRTTYQVSIVAPLLVPFSCSIVFWSVRRVLFPRSAFLSFLVSPLPQVRLSWSRPLAHVGILVFVLFQRQSATQQQCTNDIFLIVVNYEFHVLSDCEGGSESVPTSVSP